MSGFPGTYDLDLRAHLAGGLAVLPDWFDLEADRKAPRTYQARRLYADGRPWKGPRPVVTVRVNYRRSQRSGELHVTQTGGGWYRERRQKAEGRGQKSEVRGLRTEGGGQRGELREVCRA